MNNKSTNGNDFPTGFLVKDKKGRFQKINDDKVVDNETIPTASSDDLKIKIIPAQTAPAANSESFSLAPKKPISTSSKAALMMDPEEEEEIMRHAEALKKIQSGSQAPDTNSISSVINKIIQDNNLIFDNDVLKKRFEKIAESRIRGNRNSIDTQEVLVRQLKVGGMELSPEQSAAIVQKLEVESKNVAGFTQGEEPVAKHEVKISPTDDDLKTKSMFAAPPPSFIPTPTVKPVEEDIKSASGGKVEKEDQPAEASVSMPQPASPSPSTPETKIKPKVEPQPAVPPVPEVQDFYKPSQEDEMVKISRARPSEPHRTQVVDIKQPSSVVGPVEEIGEMDLKEFRRIGTSPQESSDKILEKVYLLEEESWDMRMDGIKAWQHSPLHKLYVEIGRESIEQNITVEAAINSRHQANKPYLIFEEFIAINDLNNKMII